MEIYDIPYDHSVKKLKDAIYSQKLPEFNIPKKDLYLIGENHGVARTIDLQLKLVKKIKKTNKDVNCLFLEIGDAKTSHYSQNSRYTKVQTFFDWYLSGDVRFKDVYDEFSILLRDYIGEYLPWVKKNKIKLIANDNHQHLNYLYETPYEDIGDMDSYQSYVIMYVRNKHFVENIKLHFDKGICKAAIFIVGSSHLVEEGVVKGFNVNYETLGKMIGDEGISSYNIFVNPIKIPNLGDYFLSDEPQKGIKEYTYRLQNIDVLLKY